MTHDTLSKKYIFDLTKYEKQKNKENIEYDVYYGIWNENQHIKLELDETGNLEIIN